MDSKHQELTAKFQLADSDIWQEIRKRQLDYLVSLSANESNEKYIIGGLNLIHYVDGWLADFRKEIEKEKRI